MIRLGVDTGGTFTDAVAVTADGGLALHKLPTTQEDSQQAILEAAAVLAEPGQAVSLDHGTTHATNALLTGELGKVVFVVTAGFQDLLAIGRQNRTVVHTLEPEVARPLLPSRHIVEVQERLAADGSVVTSLSQKECRRVAAAVAKKKPQAVAVLLLHSWRHAQHEQRLAKALRQASMSPSCFRVKLLRRFGR